MKVRVVVAPLVGLGPLVMPAAMAAMVAMAATEAAVAAKLAAMMETHMRPARSLLLPQT